MSASLTTNAAEGLPRRRFSVDDVMGMVRAGIIEEGERVELLGGELVPMSPKGSFHERLKVALNIYWAQRLPPGLIVATETTFRLSPDTYLEPDFVFYPESVGWDGLSGGTARLVVELSDSSLSYDRGRKAAIYASFGISELWVVDAVKLETRIHRDPGGRSYRTTGDHDRTGRLVPACAAELAVTLAELNLR